MLLMWQTEYSLHQKVWYWLYDISMVFPLSRKCQRSHHVSEEYWYNSQVCVCVSLNQLAHGDFTMSFCMGPLIVLFCSHQMALESYCLWMRSLMLLNLEISVSCSEDAPLSHLGLRLTGTAWVNCSGEIHYVCHTCERATQLRHKPRDQR